MEHKDDRNHHTLSLQDPATSPTRKVFWQRILHTPVRYPLARFGLRAYAVDYDPEHQEVRGLVCKSCAKMLAYVRADAARFQHLLTYLQNWNEDIPETCDVDL